MQPHTKKADTHIYRHKIDLIEAHHLVQIAFAVILSLMQFQIIQKYLQARGFRD